MVVLCLPRCSSGTSERQSCCNSVTSIIFIDHIFIYIYFLLKDDPKVRITWSVETWSSLMLGQQAAEIDLQSPLAGVHEIQQTCRWQRPFKISYHLSKFQWKSTLTPVWCSDVMVGHAIHAYNHGLVSERTFPRHSSTTRVFSSCGG